MTNQLHTRIASLAMAVAMTLALLGTVGGLAAREAGAAELAAQDSAAQLACLRNAARS